MAYYLTPYTKALEPYATWNGAFTKEELNWLQQQASSADQNAFVGRENDSSGIDKDIRRSQVSWLKNDPKNEWVFERLSNIVSKINAEYFRLDITCFGEDLQLTNYNHLEKGMYGWHQDYGVGVSRKISLVVQLTDPSEYEGGNLQIMTNGDPSTVSKQRGLIAVFPSYVLHQVTPVTQGSRQSLVAWVSGPAFK